MIEIINSGCYMTICFADDIELLGNNKEELQNALHQMNMIIKDKCNAMKEKTKVMKCYRTGKWNTEVFLDGKLVQVDSFKYLHYIPWELHYIR